MNKEEQTDLPQEQRVTGNGRNQAYWYKDAVIYELHVRAFHDSNGDGIGDFPGLTAKLDYLQDIGVTALWLLPFYPSPLKDDGYDIAHYTDVHPDYGTLGDFKQFLKAAHLRGLKVITELVLNHTSDQHRWFQRARHAKPGSPWRKFYVWSETPEKYRDARIIFQDFEASNWTWDPVAQSYFWHRFYSHQPDLNYDNPQVRTTILKVVDFWLNLGVDGLRLDAVPYLFEREGTTGENLLQTHAALRRLRRHIDTHFADRMLLAEANQWPEDAVAYFGDGDECHMAFHFPLMPRLFMATRMEDRFPIIDIMEQTPPIPENAQWALFLRNHDELTLEMVTEEERSYMYRSYAQNAEARINLGIRRRLAPLLGNDRRKIELLNGLLCSLPGTPVLYYGDEIGMGDNVYLGDRNGVRTPMQWSADRNAGFSSANPQQLYLPLITDHEYHHETIHVETQRANNHSLLHWMRRLIQVRKRSPVFGRGDLTFLHPSNRKVLAFVREYDHERLLVVANLSRFVQHVELDLTAFEGSVPVELFGRTEFPAVGALPYMLTLAPYIFYWFALEQKTTEVQAELDLPTLVVEDSTHSVLQADGALALEAALPRFLQAAVWFREVHPILETAITERIAVPAGKQLLEIALVRVASTGDEPRSYTMPLAWAQGARAEEVRATLPETVIAQVETGEHEHIALVYDALWSPELARALLQTIVRRGRLKGETGHVVVQAGPAFRDLRGAQAKYIAATTVQAQHNNTSIVYGDQWILKLFRCIDEGIHPEVEIGSYLTAKGFAHTPPVIASLEYRRSSEVTSLAIMQKFIPNQGEAWDWLQAELQAYFAQVEDETLPRDHLATTGALLELAHGEIPMQVGKLLGDVLPRLRLLGRRTAELHTVLAAEETDPDFAPQPFTSLYQRSLYQSMRGLLSHVVYMLRRDMDTLPEAAQDDARTILDLEQALLQRFRTIADQRIIALRTRIHGDFHLAQVLVTSGDFVIFDFEGEAQRAVSERRLKSSPLRDVATMLRSLHAATYAARLPGDADDDAWQAALAQEPWAWVWYRWAGAAFVAGYLETATPAAFLPSSPDALQLLLDTFLLEQAVYELRDALEGRSTHIRSALHMLRQMAETKTLQTPR